MVDMTPRLEQRIVRDFPESGSAQEIVRLLNELPDQGSYDYSYLHSERVMAGIVLFAQGDIGRFRAAFNLAVTDWRDLLMASGLANEDWPTVLDKELGRIPTDLGQDGETVR